MNEDGTLSIMKPYAKESHVHIPASDNPHFLFISVCVTAQLYM